MKIKFNNIIFTDLRRVFSINETIFILFLSVWEGRHCQDRGIREHEAEVAGEAGRVRGHGGELEHETGSAGKEQSSPSAADWGDEFASRPCKHQEQSSKNNLNIKVGFL